MRFFVSPSSILSFISSLSLSFSREPIGNYAEQSKTERVNERAGSIGGRRGGGEGGGENGMQLRGLVLLLHEYPIMTDYRGINSLFNQQTTYPACRLSNKIWRPWPRAPNDSLSPFTSSPPSYLHDPPPVYPLHALCTLRAGHF